MGRGRHVPPAAGGATPASGRNAAGSSPAPTVDTERVRKWLKANDVCKCPACGDRDLRIGKNFFRAEVDAGGGLPPLSRMVRVRCARCAHLLFFHARHMGLSS